MASTKTITTTIQWATFFIGNRPMSFAVFGNEPALTSANLVCQIMLQPPFKWRWNRSSVSFLMMNPAGWGATQNISSLGYAIKDSNGHLQQVTNPGQTGATEPNWNFTIGGTTSDGTVIWTTRLLSDYVVPISDYGFIEKAYISQLTGTNAGQVTEIPNIFTEATVDVKVGRPQTIIPYLDNNSGSITFRFMPGVPDQWYEASVIYQKKPPLFTNLTTVWPIPDEYSYVYNMGFLSLMYLFADSEKFAAANQKFISSLLALAEGLTEQQIMVFLGQWDFIVQNAMKTQAKVQQGYVGRST